MNKEILERLFLVASGGLLAAGLIFLGISIFGDTGTTKHLAYALICILPANLFNLIRHFNKKRK